MISLKSRVLRSRSKNGSLVPDKFEPAGSLNIRTSAQKWVEQEIIEMPRIPHVGEFDWDFPETTKGSQLGNTDNLCLLFCLYLDNREPKNNAGSESTGYLNGRSVDPRRCNCINPVLDTETHVIPQIAKTIGMLISEQDWARGLIVSCLAECDGQVFYLVGSGFSKNNPVEYPTKFIESVVRKVSRQLKQQKP